MLILSQQVWMEPEGSSEFPGEAEVADPWKEQALDSKDKEIYDLIQGFSNIPSKNHLGVTVTYPDSRAPTQMSAGRVSCQFSKYSGESYYQRGLGTLV